jgi:PAS domain S-box-containing protein
MTNSFDADTELEELYNNAPCGYHSLDSEGVFVRVNDTELKMLGYSREELLGRKFSDLITSESLPTFQQNFPIFKQRGWVNDLEFQMFRKDGTILPVSLSATAIKDAAGNYLMSRSVVIDISDRKQLEAERQAAEATLRVSEENYRIISEINPVGIFRNEITGACTYVNEKIMQLLGYPLEECLGHKWIDTLHPDDRHWVYKRWQTFVAQSAIEPNITNRFECRHLHPDGTIVWVLVQIVPERNPEGNITGYIGTLTDISDRKHLETALQTSGKMFSTLVKNAPFGIYLIDAEFRLQQINQGAEAVFSNIDPLIGRDFAEILRIIWQEPFATDAIDRFRHTLITGESYHSQANIEPRANIEEIQAYDWQIHRIILPDGSYGVVCYFYDLSEIKRAEEIIRRTAQREAFLVTLSDALRPLADPVEIQATASRLIGEYLGTNRALYFEIRGANYFVERDYVNGVEALAGSYPIDSFGQDLLAAYRAGRTVSIPDVTADPNLSQEQAAAYVEIQIIAHIGVPMVKNGEFVAGLAVHMSEPRIWTQEEVTLVEEVAERTWAAVKRAHAEADLRKSEADFRLLVTASSDALYRMNADWSEMQNLKGMDFIADTDDPERNWLEKYIPQTEQPLVMATIQSAIRTKSVFELEHRVKQVDGTVGWTFSRAVPLLDANQEIIEWFGTASDVTDRKRAEVEVANNLRDTQRLRDLSERLLSKSDIQVLYHEIVATAIALMRADGGTCQILDEGTQELVLLSTQGFDRTMTEHFYRVPASSNTSCGIALATNARTFVDFDVPESDDPDGSLGMHVNAGYLSAQSTPLITCSGKTIGMVSTHWCEHHRPSDHELRFLDLLARQAADLIEQRQAELKIREQATLLDVATDAIMVRGLDEKILFWNQGAEKLYGWTKQETLNKQANEFFYRKSEATKTKLDDIQQKIREKGKWQGELNQITKAGKKITVESRWTLVKDAANNLLSYLVVNTDITEQKQLEAQFLRTQRLD